jgi:hypothetical protein
LEILRVVASAATSGPPPVPLPLPPPDAFAALRQACADRASAAAAMHNPFRRAAVSRVLPDPETDPELDTLPAAASAASPLQAQLLLQ